MRLSGEEAALTADGDLAVCGLALETPAAESLRVSSGGAQRRATKTTGVLALGTNPTDVTRCSRPGMCAAAASVQGHP
jgi:hypothetical protein